MRTAGFEDSVITTWKIRQQRKKWGQVIGVRDMFTGGLSTASRQEMFLNSQLASWIRGKITPVMQVADTHIIKPVKVKTAQKHQKLRKELMKLAELENTRAVFECGLYEIMKTVAEVMRECIQEFHDADTVRKAMVQNCYCELRPNMEKGRFEKTIEQEWSKGLKRGSHRMRTSWLDTRFANFDEETGMPNCFDNKINPELELEHTCLPEIGQKRCLSSWKHMLTTGEMSESDFKELQEEHWFEMEVSGLAGIEGLQQYKELMKTPAQQRLDRGIDPNLKSQKRDGEKTKAKQARKEKERISKAEVSAETRKTMRGFKAEGYSLAQISTQCVRPQVGKGKKTAKSKLIGAMAKALAKAHAKKKAQASAELQELEAGGSPSYYLFGLGVKGQGLLGFMNLIIMQFLLGG